MTYYVSGYAKLLSRFNDRDMDAIGEVYQLFYNELHAFADKVFHDTGITSADLIHDIFIAISRSSIRFDSLEGIKAYIYVAIKNRLKDYLAHNSHVKDYRRGYLENNDAFETDIIETEYYSTMQYALGLLPEDSARIFRLFLEGWEAEEIAEFTGKNVRTIYNKKHEAIKKLKKKLSPGQLLLLNIL